MQTNIVGCEIAIKIQNQKPISISWPWLALSRYLAFSSELALWSIVPAALLDSATVLGWETTGARVAASCGGTKGDRSALAEHDTQERPDPEMQAAGMEKQIDESTAFGHIVVGCGGMKEEV